MHRPRQALVPTYPQPFYGWPPFCPLPPSNPAKRQVGTAGCLGGASNRLCPHLCDNGSVSLLTFALAPMPSPSVLTAVAAIGGVLLGFSMLLLGLVALLWNKLDRRFDRLEDSIREQRREDMTRMDQRFDEQDQRFDELKALVPEALKAPR